MVRASIKVRGKGSGQVFRARVKVRDGPRAYSITSWGVVQTRYRLG